MVYSLPPRSSCDAYSKARGFRGIFLLVLSLLTVHGDSASRFTPFGFAGGFGSGPTRKLDPKKKGKKGKGRLSKASLKQEVPAPVPVGPKLDKWGLPLEIKEDDIFPPMPPGTVLRAATPAKQYSLEEIQNCMEDHIDLKLDRFFDENCLGKSQNQGMSLKLLYESPPVLAIDNFFTPEECESMRNARNSADAYEVKSATFKGALSTRTSTSWFCNFKEMPILISKANRLLNIPLETMEEPQLVRYKTGQEFSWHYDEVPLPQLENGGQRLATLLVYLNDIPSEKCGGGTTFRDLKIDSKQLVVQPKSGTALLFFPAFRDGRADDRTLHKSEIMHGDDPSLEKFIVQMWVHERAYKPALPVGNSNTAAASLMEETSKKLGYSS